jgi:hypothetical protein
MWEELLWGQAATRNLHPDAWPAGINPEEQNKNSMKNIMLSGGFYEYF